MDRKAIRLEASGAGGKDAVAASSSHHVHSRQLRTISVLPQRIAAASPLADADAWVRAWPAAMSMEEAAAYSGLALAHLRRFVKMGRLACRPLGPHGRKIISRAELDRILSEELGAGMKGTSVEEDFDFG